MSTPVVLERYFGALSKRDGTGMLACFAQDAVVEDDGRTHTGRDAVRSWMEESVRRYDVDITLSSVTLDGDEARAVVFVTGSFIGSPATLSYRFVLRDGLIARLGIGF